MDESSILPGVILMMVASVGILLYVVLLIAIAAWRLLDRFVSPDTAERDERVTPRSI